MWEIAPKNSCTAKNAEKWFKGNHGKKHMASAFYYHYTVKKVPGAQAIGHQISM